MITAPINQPGLRYFGILGRAIYSELAGFPITAPYVEPRMGLVLSTDNDPTQADPRQAVVIN